MTKNTIIEGIAAPIPIANLDTDQVMPKQFLRGIDKAGLARGVMYDLRFDEQGKPRETCLEPAGVCQGTDYPRRRQFWLRIKPGTRRVGPAAVRRSGCGCLQLWRDFLFQCNEQRFDACQRL
jgi:hypothetical protein